MLKAEAQWVGHSLRELPSDAISPLLNVGSSTGEFRRTVQPWITQEIFNPLAERGVAVDHLDIKEGEGIDLHGDLMDEAFVNGLSTRGYRSLLCCNLLEHVHDRSLISARLESLVPEGGYLIITVPREFPFHADPIDTMFRPSPEEIAQLFCLCHLVTGDVLDCGQGWDYVDRNPLKLVSNVTRRLLARNEGGGISGTTSFVPWLFRTFRQSCAVLQRRGS